MRKIQQVSKGSGSALVVTLTKKGYMLSYYYINSPLMWKYSVLIIIALTITLVVPASNLVQAKFKFPSNDFANAETKDRIYSFDFDFSLVYGEAS